MRLPPDVEEKAVSDASNMGDNVVRSAQWFCMQREGLFPGEDLFDGNHGHQSRPYCGSSGITVPERIDSNS
jgi:hypothetical protein